MKNSNATLKREIKNEGVLLLEIRLDDKFDVMTRKHKELDDKMSTMKLNISTTAQYLSIMTQNHNTIMEMLQKLRSSTNHINNLGMLD